MGPVGSGGPSRFAGTPGATLRAVPPLSGAQLPEFDGHAGAFIAVSDAQGILSYASATASEAFGVSQADAVGKSIFQFVVPGSVEQVRIRHSGMSHHPEVVLDEDITFITAEHRSRVFAIEASSLVPLSDFTGILMSGSETPHRLAAATDRYDGRQPEAGTHGGQIEFSDPYVAGHHQRVAEVAIAIAHELALSDEDVRAIETAASLHDIGEIGSPSGMLTRDGNFSRLEIESFKDHPRAGAMVVADIGFPWSVAELILQHHECIDGSGYPEGLRGPAIAVGSQILAVADAVASMTSRRLYRPAVDVEPALREIMQGRGRLYDGDIVDTCVRLSRQGGLSRGPLGMAS